MAKTIEELVSGFNSDISSNPFLSSKLTSISNAAVFRVIASVVFKYSVDINKEALSLVQTASNTVTSQRVHSRQWLEGVSKEFQYGDELTVINTRSELSIGQYNVTYSKIDESKRIVSFAHASDETGQIFLKVAKLSGDVPKKLNEDELNSFINFIDNIIYLPNFTRKPAIQGGETNVISIDGDTIDISFIAELDQNIFILGSLDPLSNGVNINSGLKELEKTISNILKTPNNFGGKVRISNIVDSVMSITGVRNFVITAITGEGVTKPLEDITLNARKEYETESGYVANVNFTTIVYE